MISTNRLYSPEEPWEFAGKILFYNDGSLEDYSRFIEIEGRFQGYTDRNRELNKVTRKIFLIKESDDLVQWRTHRFSSEKQHNHQPLYKFDEMLVDMGISPKRYLLYWKQGETYKFTKIRDTERFNYFADMMDLSKGINELDRQMKEQVNRENELQALSLSLQHQQIDLRKLEVEKDRKLERDALLWGESASFIGKTAAMFNYNIKSRWK